MADSAFFTGSLTPALNFVAHVAMRGGMILFVTTNRDTMFDVEKAAEEVSCTIGRVAKRLGLARRYPGSTLGRDDKIL
ncbi:unnamed protein product [Caenorhabditis auriculariae]|uniref:Uncharacterized protein n=1 Tax=Caenorhabditis auriculariae TaxID=2777116 RepID=A0A8S1HSR4_9PELO|nr:unnamed protein product [Caenorhabditis auriculariae]